jgi:hypothetical protein
MMLRCNFTIISFKRAKNDSILRKKSNVNQEVINFYKVAQKIKIRAIVFPKRKIKKKIIQKKCTRPALQNLASKNNYFKTNQSKI